MRSDMEIIVSTMAHFPEEIANKIRYDLSYTAPEILLSKFSYLFNVYVPPKPTEPWHFKAIATLTNTSLEEVQQMYGGDSEDRK